MTGWLVLGGLALLATFGLGVWLGRKSVTTTGAPTPPTANAATTVTLDTAEDAEQAAQAAEDAAKKKAAEVMHASDADVRADVDRLRALGRTVK